MKKLIMFLPSINNGGNEKNFFSTANNLHKRKIKISIVTCSGNKALKKLNFKNNCKLLNFDKFNLKVKFFISFIHLIIVGNKSTPILSFQGNIFAIIAGKLLNTRVIIRFNSHPYNFIKSEFKKKIFKFFYKKADIIIVNSEDIKKTLKKEYKLNSNLIRNELDKYKIRKQSKNKIKFKFFKNNSRKTLINVGRLDKNKNQVFLINSLHKIEKKLKFNLIIIGSGKEKINLLKRVKDLNLKNYVKIIDFQKNPYPFIKSCDFLVLSSFYEGYPNVLLEAGCLRIPIISSDCRSGPLEITQGEKNGYLYKNNNFFDFEKKIKKIFFSSKFSISKKINNLEKFIEKNHFIDNSKLYYSLIFKK